MPRQATVTVTASSLRQTIERARAEGRERQFRVKDAPGLWLRVSRNGTASWSLVYVRPGPGTLGRYSLGIHPEVKIDAAMAAAAEWRLTIAQGIDPHAAKAEAIADRQHAAEKAEAEARAKAARITIKAAVEAFLVAKADRRSVGSMRTALTNELVTPHGDLAADDLTEEQVRAIHRTIAARGARHADNVLQIIKSFLSWSLDEKLVTKHVAKSIKKRKSGKESTRERKLSAAEMRVLWLVVSGDNELSPKMCRIIQLAVLLGGRANEIAGARKAEFAADLMTWTIPATRMKGKVEHTLPLPPMARAILKEAIAEAKGVHLFSAREGVPFRSSSVAHTMGELQAKLLARADSEGSGAFRDADGKHVRCGMHDLRRTLATGLQKLGVPTDTVGAVLSHSKQGSVTTAHYAQHGMLEEMREALTRWQAAVSEMIQGRDPFAPKAEAVAEMERRLLGDDVLVSAAAPSAPNVVPLRRAAG